jgi:hypothetical protein
MRDGLFQLPPMLLGHRLHFRFRWWYSLLTSAPVGKLELGKRFELLTEHGALLRTRQVQSTKLCEPSKMVPGGGSRTRKTLGLSQVCLPDFITPA